MSVQNLFNRSNSTRKYRQIRMCKPWKISRRREFNESVVLFDNFQIISNDIKRASQVHVHKISIRFSEQIYWSEDWETNQKNIEIQTRKNKRSKPNNIPVQLSSLTTKPVENRDNTKLYDF